MVMTLSLKSTLKKAALSPSLWNPSRPAGLPWLGLSPYLNFDQDAERTYARIYELFPSDIVPLGYHPGVGRIVLIHSPELMQQILEGDIKHFKLPSNFARIQSLLGSETIVTTSEKARWEVSRKALLTYFSAANLYRIFAEMEASICRSLESGVVDARNVYKQIPALAAASYASGLFGQGFSHDEGARLASLISAVGRAGFSYLFHPLAAMLIQQKTLRSEYHDCAIRLVEASQRKRGSIVYHMVHEHGLSVPQVVEEVKTLLFTGLDSTIKTCRWAIFHLRKDPELSAGLFGEGARPSMQADFLREVMRLHPSLVALSRQAVDDWTVPGLRLRKGDVVLMPLVTLHRHTRYWRDPLAFDVSRWKAPDQQDAIRKAYMPFGKGPRSCLGAHLGQSHINLLLKGLAQKKIIGMGR